jgi:GTA TIM-barrel-like domain/Putative phage tail protein
MSSLILSSVGSTLFGPVGGFLGALAGAQLDAVLQAKLAPARVQASRLSNLKVQASREGASIPIVYGRFRLSGEVIWASRFREVTTKRTVGGKAGQRVVERSYLLSFAIGLCEGEVGGLGRVWANGEVMDLSLYPHRVYNGSETQMPDPLIEAVEGIGQAPAFRGLAYVVFEEFPVTEFGDRIPQLSFEVVGRGAQNPQTPRLEDMASGVCLIPGAGEFAYATSPIRRVIVPGHEVGENQHAEAGRANIDVALDQLQRDLPNVSSVSLVVSWFGDDLRAGHCTIRPKVENATKVTQSRLWSVAGLDRTTAQLVSQSGGAPAYGGAPDDQSVIEAIIALKSRGLKVVLNPFIMMDIPLGNALPNPHAGSAGASGQPPYPWRGRISCHPGIGQADSADGTALAAEQIAAFFGTASASHYHVANGQVSYSGPNEWTFRRFVLHQAALAKAAGGVDTFLLGSEMIGLTRVRSADGSFPAVGALKALAGEVRLMLGAATRIGYGADWTEYGAYNPPGTADLRFPLDPLWADANCDFVGLDWYAPLTDRRDDDPPPTLESLQAGIEGGEGYDFYYASDAARLARERTPITDGLGEPWVWRQKDIRAFWSLLHTERLDGVPSPQPTPWVPQSKPIWLLELGFPAVDKGANRPSVFPDPKSAESGLPPFSSGRRDDLEQRHALEAVLSYWPANNAVSAIDGRPMMDTERTHLWAWDARPYPAFPSREDIWSDGANAATGHWLAGRTGAANLALLIDDICRRAGLDDVDTAGVAGCIDGYQISGPVSARSVLEGLGQAFGLEAMTRSNGVLQVRTAPHPVADTVLGLSGQSVTGPQAPLTLNHAPNEGIGRASLSAFAIERDFDVSVQTVSGHASSGVNLTVAIEAVLGPDTREGLTTRLTQDSGADQLSGGLSPFMSLQLEVGDRFELDGGIWRVDRLEGAFGMQMQATRAPKAGFVPSVWGQSGKGSIVTLQSTPVLHVLDLPAPWTSPADPRPNFLVASEPWASDISVGLDRKASTPIARAARLGTLASALPSGPVGRLIPTRPYLHLELGTLDAGQAGKGVFLDADGQVVDIVSWRSAILSGAQVWQLTGVVRGLSGLSKAPLLEAGTRFAVLDDALTLAQSFDPALLGAALTWTSYRGAEALGQSDLVRFSGQAALCWPPCHAKARRTDEGIALTWTRRGRGDGDAWAGFEPALGALREKWYGVIKAENGAVVRTFTASSPSWLYPSDWEISDFGSALSQLSLEICQVGDGERHGMKLIDTLVVLPL